MGFEDIVTSYGLIGLFILCFASSSILPIPAEPGIILATTKFNATYVFIFAFFGSLLGAILNYVIGLKGIHGIVKRNVKKEKELERWFNKYGAIILILVPWIPFIGDPLTIVAGALKMKFIKFLLWISIGKFIKIFVVVLIGMSVLNSLHI